MAIDLFGYNGVFGLTEAMVNKLLATYLYERYLVELDGKVTDGDFIGPLSISAQGVEVRLYFLTGKPSLTIQTHDGSNQVLVDVPFIAIAVYAIANGIPIKFDLGKLFALQVSGLPVSKTDTGLSIDFSTVTADAIHIAIITVQAGPTGVGGVETSEIVVTDQVLDTQLQANNVPVTAKQIRTELASFLQSGAIGPTSVPVSPGGSESALQNWDLMLFDSGGDGGADMLLYAADGSGSGERTEAGDAIPPSPTLPPFGYVASVRASVLLADIDRTLDQGEFFVQGGTLNGPNNPLGYMVVPEMGTHAYALPAGPGKVTVPAPAGGNVQVILAAGSLATNSRARLRNLDRGADVSFVANGSGGASPTIRADAGERLAFTVDAVSGVPSDSSVVLWRPRIQFQEGSLAISFHWYKYIPNWCDAEGDATVTVALAADIAKPFHVDVKIVDVNGSLPWWVYAVTWLGLGIIGQDVFAPLVLALIPTIAHAVANDLLAGKDPGSVLGPLTDQISAPNPDNVALLLDSVEVHETGLVLTGRADAGMILNYDRTAAFSTQNGVLLSKAVPNPVVLRFDWRSSIAGISVTSSGPWAIITNSPEETFWAAAYDDLPPDALFSRDPLPLSSGDAAMVWVAVQGGHAKVLFERPPGGDAPSTGIIITWIAFRDRVTKSVKLVNKLKATAVGGADSLLLQSVFYKYDGEIPMVTRKFFLTDETRALGQEHWYWDDQEVTSNGISVPGGTVTLDATNRKLIVHLDQAGQLGSGQDIAVMHWVKFSGTDVFGTTLETKILVQTPPVVLHYKGIGPSGPFRPIPIGDPWERVAQQVAAEVTSLLATRLAPAEAAALGKSIGDALATGEGRLDAAGASGVLALIGQRGLGG